MVCLTCSVRWPRGTYALPMPDSGCPRSKRVSWSEGSLRQNTEDTSPLSNWSNPNHLRGHRKNNEITLNFCVKEKKGGNVDWPAGKYCIYKKGKCPNGKNKLKIRFDVCDLMLYTFIGTIAFISSKYFPCFLYPMNFQAHEGNS